MFSRIRKRCTYANVAATMALFFAISGGALAAGHYLITSTKQISPKVLTSLKGKAGPAGKNGANGTNGAAGPAGATGPIGPQGPAGSSGANGESVTSTEFTGVKYPCKKGGSEFKIGSATPTYACNGSGGSGGGGAATSVGTLAEGKTETGTWDAQTDQNNNGLAPISFAIPLAAALNVEGCGEEPATRTKPCQLHYISVNNTEITHTSGGPVETANSGPCNEGTAAAPKAATTEAEPGVVEPNLCLYAVEEKHGLEPLTGSHSTAFPVGVVVHFDGEPNEGRGFGTWALTAGEAG
jgi:hypothetical protein